MSVCLDKITKLKNYLGDIYAIIAKCSAFYG